MKNLPNKLKEIEQTHRHICDECQSGIFYPPKDYQTAAEHILNASTLLYNDAAGIVRRDTAHGQKSNLTLAQISEVLRKILDVMFAVESFPIKEDSVRDVLESYRLAADQFLISDDWSGGFYQHVEL